jgi:hypothetical protein
MSDDDRKYWFRAKKYGWGWTTPATWQGWTIYAAYFAAIAGCLVSIQTESQRAICIVSITALLIIVVVLKGERPLAWRWGKK